jgi:hypothetical protein
MVYKPELPFYSNFDDGLNVLPSREYLAHHKQESQDILPYHTAFLILHCHWIRSRISNLCLFLLVESNYPSPNNSFAVLQHGIVHTVIITVAIFRSTSIVAMVVMLHIEDRDPGWRLLVLPFGQGSMIL